MNTATIITQSGFTGKDHLLQEIARKAEASLKPDGYSSKAAARKAAERAWFRTVNETPLYAGCGAGFAKSV